MPAYYVDSGDLHVKIMADTPYRACVKALNQCKDNPPRSLGVLTKISERGTDHLGMDTPFVFTMQVLKDLNLTQNYKVDTSMVDALFENYEDVDDFAPDTYDDCNDYEDGYDDDYDDDYKDDYDWRGLE